MNNKLDILIMAAGLGTRMRSGLAKVLHRLDGRPLINHVCETALKLGPEKIYVVVGNQAQDVKAAVLNEIDDGIVEFVVQKQQLGTGDAVNAAREFLENSDSTVLVLSGDVPMIRAETLKAFVAAHAEHGGACTVLSVQLKDPTGYGRIIRDENGGLAGIVEQRDATEEQTRISEINSGIWCFDARKLFAALARLDNKNDQGEFYLTDVPRIMRADGENVGIFLADDPRQVEGVNDRRQLADMEKVIRRCTISRLMLESGVTFVDPKTAYISSQAEIGRDTVIYQNVTIEWKSVIGEGCTIRPGTRVTNSTVGNGVEIRDNCFITDSTVGDGCTVGPMAHLRGHAVMMEGSKVGNFVELKKTKLGKGSKASHLSYLGDATIGEDTNIGAGTITCNYDGKNKHETHIGAGVKIGSDTMLVAPITVGDGAVTGAGSVIIKDVPPNKLMVGAPARAIRSLDKEEEKGVSSSK